MIETISSNQIKVGLSKNDLNSLEIITLPYPGFPTDLQAQSCALACKANGISILTERVYPSRFMHVPELMRMGADIAMEGASSVVKGKSKLTGAPVMASDLRASAALILGYNGFITLIVDMTLLRKSFKL